ncbi:Uncharacterised protein [Mycobacteroides abscessus subsp. abscessus]|nr:Uncharacterised protein [Mycobacteroides abscessus subsp. abscessus]
MGSISKSAMSASSVCQNDRPSAARSVGDSNSPRSVRCQMAKSAYWTSKGSRSGFVPSRRCV